MKNTDWSTLDAEQTIQKLTDLVREVDICSMKTSSTQDVANAIERRIVGSGYQYGVAVEAGEPNDAGQRVIMGSARHHSGKIISF